MVSLKKVLEIPSYSGMEDRIVEFIVNFCKIHDFQYEVDAHKNVYITKGTPYYGDYYPCVVAHTDTVHFDQKDLIEADKKITIIEYYKDSQLRMRGFDPINGRPTGIGGDDKCGVYICLKLLLEFDILKVAFFVKEEIGMQGSKCADEKFFSDVGYAIQFDGPTRNWVSKTLMGKNLYSEMFLDNVKPLLENYNVTNFSDDPYTDVYQLVNKFDFCCANFPTGYYNWHMVDEYVVPEETEECYQLGRESILKLGLKKYKYKIDYGYKNI